MASQENDRLENTNPVRRKSKGKKKVSKTTGTQSQKFVEVGMLDALGRLVIAPAGTIGFIPGFQSANAIMDSIVSCYRDAWSSWEEVPVYDREQMWNHFKTQCAWYPQHEYHIFCNFEINAAFLLNKTLESAWEMNQKPDWMLEGLWARLIEKRTTEKFQKPSIQAKAPGTHQRILEKKKRRTMTYDEVSREKRVKNRKNGHNTLVEPHVERKNVGYKKGLDEWRQSQPTSEDDSLTQSPEDDEASILSKKIGGLKKDKAHVLGSEHCIGCVTYGFASASLKSGQNQEEIDSEIKSLLIQVQELLKKQKADRLRLDGLENLVVQLIDNCRSEESDNHESDGEK
ncbi:hypothetical protein RDI58_008512 [Solanum bulbocastanum]|uniref:Uncharacterized protein n=1 Tax=Solanum bulbocastanum TaxID=147425 RepID=A0AAN8TXB3_SOLBU